MGKQIVVCAALVFATAGCGGGYIVTPARLLVTDAEGISVADLRSDIGPMLEASGFEDLGKDEEMIALVRRSAPNEETGALRASDLLNQYTYLNDRRNLRVEVTDYTDVARRRPRLPYETPAGPFFEIRLYEHRPGGFSSSGKLFLAELREHLGTLGGVVTLAVAPPATDDAEYWRVTLGGFAAGILNWLTAFGVTTVVTGGISYQVLKGAPMRVSAKRGAFVLVNVWLATPLPFPVATILVVLLPNLLAFPWTDLDYYGRVLDSAVVSFPISLALCAVISRRMFRNSSAHEGAA